MASGDDQLITYILRAREKGRDDEQIARSLYSVGWRKERVDAALRQIEDSKASGEQMMIRKEEGAIQPSGPAKPQQTQEGRVQLAAVPPSQSEAQRQPLAARIQPPPISPSSAQQAQEPGMQPSQKQAQQPVIPSAGARSPIELPGSPQYPKVADEGSVQNPAFSKIQGGIANLDLGLVVRIVVFLIIVAIVVWGYLLLSAGTGPKIS